MPPVALCATKSWTGANNGLFSNSLNWSPNGAPAAGDDLVFQSNNLVSRTAVTNDFSPNRASRTFTINPGPPAADLRINAILSSDAMGLSSAGFTKMGAGTLYLASTNTYNGVTTVSEGQLAILTDRGLGSTLTPLFTSAGTVVNGSGNLFLSNVQVTNENLTVNSTGGGQGLGASGASVWTGDILLNSDVSISSSSSLILNGTITGVGGFTKIGGGSITLGGTTANTYAGTTTVRDGTLLLNKDSALGAMSGPLIIGEDETPANTDIVRFLGAAQLPADTDVTINASGLLDLNGFVQNVRNVVFNGGDVNTGAGSILSTDVITVNQNTNSQAVVSGRMSVLSNPIINVTGHYFSPDLRIDAQLIGAGGFTKNGIGEVSLTASNSFTGMVTVNDGFFELDNSNALGSTNAGTVVNSSAVLALRFDTHVPPKPITLAGDGQSSFGALSSSFGSNSWAGNITLSANAICHVGSGDFLNLTGAINGGFDITKTGPGTLILSGSTANSFDNLFVNAGTVAMANTVANAAGPVRVGVAAATVLAFVRLSSLHNALSPLVAIKLKMSAEWLTHWTDVSGRLPSYARYLRHPQGRISWRLPAAQVRNRHVHD